MLLDLSPSTMGFLGYFRQWIRSFDTATQVVQFFEPFSDIPAALVRKKSPSSSFPPPRASLPTSPNTAATR